MFTPDELDFTLNGVKVAKIEIQKESPRARIMLVLKAQNFSNTRIMEELEKIGMKTCISTINTTVRQAWFLKDLAKLLAIRGSDISAKLGAFEDDAIATLVNVMLNEEEKGNVRAQCAVDLIKAKNGIKIVNESKPRDLESLKKETEQLEKELAELTPKNRLQALENARMATSSETDFTPDSLKN
jgi:hypothetical protein